MMPMNQHLHSLKRSAIRRFTNLARENPDCILLTIGEPDFDTPQPIKDAAAQALAAGRTHYAPNQGTMELRTAVAEFESRRGFACTAEQVLITAGATGALYTALTGILNPGDEVVIPTPAFNLYETIVLAAGAVPVPLDISKTGFQIDKDALSRAVTDKTRAVVLNSPNNPTGVVLNQASMDAVKQVVLGRPVWVICDQVYRQLALGVCPDLSLDPEMTGQLLLCQSFSKPYAMTGWRAGYLIGPAWIIERLLLLHAAQISTIPTFIQDACVTALEQDVRPMAEIYARRREYLCRRLGEMGLIFPKPQGAFYVLADISRFSMDSEEFCTRLIKEAAVAAVPGSCFGAEGFIRISCACSDDRLEEGLNRLERFIEKLS